MTRSSLLYVSAALTLSFVSPPAIVEYPLPRPRAFPHDPAVGRDGIVWYTDQANSYIGRLDPATGQVTDYPTPTQASGPHGIIVAPDGGVWYTGNFKGRLGRLDPATGAIKEYMLPAPVAGSSNCSTKNPSPAGRGIGCSTRRSRPCA